MVLVIDNYDSFTYNLVQALRSLGREVKVVKNDEIDVEGIAALKPEALVLSPGPGNPDSAGVTLAAIRAFAGKVPMLGVCLGHQSIAQAFDGRIVAAKKLMHGKTSRVRHDGKGIFEGIPQNFEAMRYHSLAVERGSLPDCFEVSAESEDGEIMGLRHRTLPIESVQYHPESIGTPEGLDQLRNFLGVGRPVLGFGGENAYRTMGSLMRGEMSEREMTAFLLDMNEREIDADVLTGAARAMREAGTKVDLGGLDAVDIVGTGGDGRHTINVSTTAAFIAAGAGVAVAKHGNVAATSKCGAADVLAALGCNLSLPPERVAECVREIGIGFLFAKALHPAMRYAAPVRKALGCKTIFNLLGPITNPASVKRHAIGVYDPKLAPLVANALKGLGSVRALVFSSVDGFDELSPCGLSFVSELRDGKVVSSLLSGAKLCGGSYAEDELTGGEPDENARTLRGILDGSVGGARREACVLNAAAAIFVSGKCDDMLSAVALARESLASGRALAKLDALIDFGRRAS